ncbi:hypothetical protein D3C85_1808620 [compost metagenome]
MLHANMQQDKIRLNLGIKPLQLFFSLIQLQQLLLQLGTFNRISGIDSLVAKLHPSGILQAVQHRLKQAVVFRDNS